jgi:hypothetical protein
MSDPASWYARRLNQPSRQPVAPVTLTPIPQQFRPNTPVEQWQQQQQSQALTPEEEKKTGPKVRQAAARQEQEGLCPACGSDYYTGAPGHAKWCLDCGYPKQQQFQGVMASGPVAGKSTAQGNWSGFSNATKVQL